jgi:hypothetical protein
MSTESAAVHGGDRTPPADSTAAIPPAGPSRASDAERADTVARLHAALGTGRLDLAETDERVAAAYAARYRHELAALLADLPDDETSFTDPPRWAALWTLAVWRARTAVTGAVGPRPTTAQLRSAVLVAVAAVAWLMVCAVVGALAVGA